jgi:hypothetical protein
MPSSSAKQHRFMEAVAHSPAFAKKVGVPQSVGKDFSNADKGRKFSKGGDMATKMMGMKKGGMKKMAAGGDTTMSNPSRERRGMTMEKMGKVTAGGTKKFGEHSVQQKGHTRGKNMGDAGKTVGIMSGAKNMKRGGKC